MHPSVYADTHLSSRIHSCARLGLIEFAAPTVPERIGHAEILEQTESTNCRTAAEENAHLLVMLGLLLPQYTSPGPIGHTIDSVLLSIWRIMQMVCNLCALALCSLRPLHQWVTSRAEMRHGPRSIHSPGERAPCTLHIRF